MQPTQQSKIKVLIGDSSVRSRMVLAGIIDAQPFWEVVDTAQTRDELLEKSAIYQPEVVVAQQGLTVDGHLPCFQPVCKSSSSLCMWVAQKYVLSSTSIDKASVPAPFLNFELIKKLHDLLQDHYFSTSRSNALHRSGGAITNGKSNSIEPIETAPLCVVVIGASTGGSTAIEYVLRDLETTQPTVVLVAVHMPEKFTKRFAKRLQKITHWQVEEGCAGMLLKANTVVIAPGGQNMVVCRSKHFKEELSLNLIPSVSPVLESPSIDALMRSAAEHAQKNVLGVIMTGMGQDGTKGAQAIKEMGGIVIAQNAETSAIFGMAKSAIASGVVHGVVALGQIHSFISRFAAERHMSHALQSDLSR